MENNPEKLSDIHDHEAMEFYNSRYFIINKNMMTILGLWPYQKKVAKISIRIFISFGIIISMIPQIISAIQMTKNVARFIQAIGTLIYTIAVSAKFLGLVFTESKMKFLYKNIVQNRKIVENETEKQILKKSSEIGRLLTIGYIGYMIQAAIGFATLPAAHHMFDIIWPLANGSRSSVFILDGEYLVDKQQYYYYINLFEAFLVFSTVPLICTIDSTYAVCVQQCVGLLEIVKVRLELATKRNNKFKTIIYPINDATHTAIAKSAELHDRVLKFGQILESSYSTSLLFVMICNVLVLATASVNILFNLSNKLLLLRFILIIVGFTIHMFYLSWPGQKMIDGSNDIFYAAYNNEWYECSVESQQLLKFIMRRTIEPFCLTAGGFYIMNFENFKSLFQTSMSYITVLSSFNT